MEIYLLIGGLGFIACALLFVFYIGKDYGEEKEENETLEADKEAIREAQQVKAAVNSLDSAELRKRAGKWVRK